LSISVVVQNWTAVADHDNRRCFVMPLNGQAVSPPKSFADLLEKYDVCNIQPLMNIKTFLDFFSSLFIVFVFFCSYLATILCLLCVCPTNLTLSG